MKPEDFLSTLEPFNSISSMNSFWQVRPIPIDRGVIKKDKTFLDSLDGFSFTLDWLHWLGFDIYGKVFRYGISYAKKYWDEKIFGCQTVLKDRYILNKGKFEYYQHELHKRIKKHFLSPYRQRGYTYPEYYKGKFLDKEVTFRESGFNTTKELTSKHKEWLKQKITATGLSRSKDSNVIGFDLDNHTLDQQVENHAESTLMQLLFDLDYLEPIILERSVVNGGYHAFFLFKEFIPMDSVKNYVQGLRQEGYSIEVHEEGKPLNLPMSSTYLPLKILNMEAIKSSTEYTLKTEPIVSIRHLIGESLKVAEKAELVSWPEIGISTPSTKVTLAPIQGKSSSVCNGVRTSPRVLEVLNNFPITRGNRIGGKGTHKLLAAIAIKHGISKEEFRYYSRINNRGSFDLTNATTYQFNKLCDKLYDGMSQYIIPLNYSGNQKNFYSNIALIPVEVQSAIKKYLDALDRFIPRKSHTIWGKDFRKATDSMLQELIGRVFYNVTDDSPLYSFSREVLYAQQKFYDYRSDPRTVLDFLLHYGLLFRVISDSGQRKRNYEPGKETRKLAFYYGQTGLSISQLALVNLEITTAELDSLKNKEVLDDYVPTKEVRAILFSFLDKPYKFSKQTIPFAKALLWRTFKKRSSLPDTMLLKEYDEIRHQQRAS